jgi:hypothetical protein
VTPVVRIGMSFILSFVLFYVQCLIVMEVFHYENGIRFDNYAHVGIVCLVNFFLVLAIMTQLTPWFMRVSKMKLEEE